MNEFKNYLLKEDLLKKYINEYCDKIKGNSVILFGTGSGGINSYKLLKMNNLEDKISFFCDNDTCKQGENIFGVKIISPNELIEIYTDEIIIITCTAVEQVAKQLMKLGIPEEKIIYNDFTYCNLEGEFEFIKSNIEKFGKVYDILNDEKSKQVFLQLINYKISHDEKYLKNVSEDYEKKSLDNKVINLKDNSVYVDCGSYQGDTLLNFIKIFGNEYKKIICIEPNKENFKILLNEIANKDIKNVECYNTGIWSKEDILKFNIKGSGSGTVSKEKGVEIQVNKLDNILKDENKIDLIKLDISGSEKEALLGAQEIIEKYTPILSVSVYNKIEDFFEIPNIIKTICSDYKIYFRHYSKYNECSTTCYAIKE